NPGVPLPTARVFAALAARARSAAPHRSSEWDARPAAEPAAFFDLDALLLHMRARGNDLERAATSLLPAIAEVKAALSAAPQCRLAAMSGSGPTCFGIFTDDGAAERATEALARAHPGWWIAATRLDCSPAVASGVRRWQPAPARRLARWGASAAAADRRRPR